MMEYIQRVYGLFQLATTDSTHASDVVPVQLSFCDLWQFYPGS